MINAPLRGDRPTTPTLVRQSMHESRPDIPIPELPLPLHQAPVSVHRERNSASFGPSQSPPPKGKLRPMTGINRYEKHRMVTVEDVVTKHVCPPVTTQFLR